MLEVKKRGQGSERGDEEWNGDTMDRNRDRTEEELPATGSDNGDCASEPEIKRGHETRDIHLTNDLLFNLD